MEIPEFHMTEKRFTVSLPVSSEKYGLGTRASLRMRNISKSGALLHVLRSLEFFKKGDLLRLTVDLFEIKKKKVVNAEIVWLHKDKIGVTFVLPDEVIKKLFRHVS